MKIVMTIAALLVGLLSIAAGGAKVAQVPQEVEFLGQFGLVSSQIVAFGGVQVLAGLLLWVPRTRFYGSIIAAAAFAVSTALLLVDGNLAFASISMVPVLLAAWVGYQSRQRG